MRQNATAIVKPNDSAEMVDSGQNVWQVIQQHRFAKPLAELIRYAGSCSFVLAVKLSLTWLLTRWLHGSLSYLLVHIVTFFLSYSIHTRVTFGSSYSLEGMRKYFAAVIGFKLLDYLIFSVLFAAFNVTATVAVLSASIGVMLLRFIVVRKILKANKKDEGNEIAGASA